MNNKFFTTIFTMIVSTHIMASELEVETDAKSISLVTAASSGGSSSVSAISAVSATAASGATNSFGRRLVLGCCPWDKSIVDVAGISNLEFSSPYYFEKRTDLGNFHHLDWNDKGLYGGGKFSEFAAANKAQFASIIIYWSTYDKISRSETWKDLFDLLQAGGEFIIPVYWADLSKTCDMKEKVEETTSWLKDVLVRAGFANNQLGTLPLPLDIIAKCNHPILDSELSRGFMHSSPHASFSIVRAVK